jgi:membrane protein implicated in regulation of membrane protease activity
VPPPSPLQIPVLLLLLASLVALGPLLLLLLQRLRHRPWRPGNSLVRQEDLVGQSGQVLLPCSDSLRGVVRLQVRGCLIDSAAYGIDQRRLHRGDPVVVLHQEGVDLWVGPAFPPAP